MGPFCGEFVGTLTNMTGQFIVAVWTIFAAIASQLLRHTVVVAAAEQLHRGAVFH